MSESWSESFRIQAKDWVGKDAAASLLEETKTLMLSQKMMALGDMPVSRAEMHVKASVDWYDYVSKMVKAREDANLAKVRLEYIRLKFSEQQSEEATARSERRL